MDTIAYMLGVILEVLRGNLDAEAAVEFLREYLWRK